MLWCSIIMYAPELRLLCRTLYWTRGSFCAPRCLRCSQILATKISNKSDIGIWFHDTWQQRQESKVHKGINITGTTAKRDTPNSRFCQFTVPSRCE